MATAREIMTGDVGAHNQTGAQVEAISAAP